MDFRHDLTDLIPEPEPQVERHLVVTRTPGMKLRAGWHTASQLRLDVHMNIFQLGLPLELTGLDFLADGV